MQSTKAIKTRIGSVKNTRKITKAMQMISAVKMRKAVESAVRSRAYALLSLDIMNSLQSSKLVHPLAEERQTQKELLIVITSNRGLCGSYNSSVLKKFREYSSSSASPVDVIAMGNKAARFANKLGQNLVAVYDKLLDSPSYDDAIPLSKSIIADFKLHRFDKVNVIYTNYISGLKQEVEMKQLLPVTKQNVTAIVNQTGGLNNMGFEEDEVDRQRIFADVEYVFEPNKVDLLDYVLPMLVEIQLYQAMLESSASEHSSRMIAMKAATDAAADMIYDLTLQYNKNRQAAITQEISEIVAGANAI